MSAEPAGSPLASASVAGAAVTPGASSARETSMPTPAKVDPESLAIRSRPRRAIRFRRGLIVAISAAGSISLVAVTWAALKPAVFQKGAQEESLAQPDGKGASDALGSLPATYGDVPRLGPPLPGDLGRPILERQRQLAAEYGPPVASTAGQAEAAEGERQLAERKAARESALMVSRGQAESSASAAIESLPAPSGAALAAPGDSAPRLALDPTKDPNAQQHKADFVAGPGPRAVVNPHALTAAISPWMLSAGSVIPASLITGIRSDLPGLVTAQVTERIYDSPTGRTLLIPQGARLVGTYDSVVAYGQKRALIVWQRLVLPDGSSLSFDNVPATDPSGYVGLEDRVDFHTWQLIKGVALSTLLGTGSELAFTGESDLVEALRESAQSNTARAGDRIAQRNLDIQPTITIRPGAPVRLVVHKDLLLDPWLEHGAPE